MCLRDSIRDRASAVKKSQVTFVVPAPARLTLWQRIRPGRNWPGLVGPLRSLERVSVVIVRDHAGPGHHPVGNRLWVSPRRRHVAIILAGRLDRSVLKAIRYAKMIDTTDIRAVHAAIDPLAAAHLAEQWGEVGNVLGVPLDVEECFDRNIARTITEYVRRVEGPEVEVTVVLPRRDYPRLTERLLHDHTSRAISRALEGEPHVDVVVIPYRLGASPGSNSAPPGEQRPLHPVAEQAVR